MTFNLIFHWTSKYTCLVLGLGQFLVLSRAFAQTKITKQTQCQVTVKTNAVSSDYKAGRVLQAQSDAGVKVSLKVVRVVKGLLTARIDGPVAKCPKIVGYTLNVPPALAEVPGAKDALSKAAPDKNATAKNPNAAKAAPVKKNFVSVGLVAGYQSMTVASTGKPSVKGIAVGGFARYEGRGGVVGPVFGVGARKYTGKGTDVSRDISVKLTMDTLGMSALSGLYLGFESVPALRLYGLVAYEFGLSGTMKFDNPELVATSYKIGSQSRLGADIQAVCNIAAGFNMGLNLTYFGGGFKYTNSESNDRFNFTGYSADLILSYDF